MIGTFNESPPLHTLLYECKFNDGTTKEYAANMIASNIFMESDADKFSSSLLYHIDNHKCFEWANSSRQWIDLKILKESNPVLVAEYAMARNIVEEPAFAWWMPYVLRKRDAIILAVNS